MVTALEMTVGVRRKRCVLCSTGWRSYGRIIDIYTPYLSVLRSGGLQTLHYLVTSNEENCVLMPLPSPFCFYLPITQHPTPGEAR